MNYSPQISRNMARCSIRLSATASSYASRLSSARSYARQSSLSLGMCANGSKRPPSQAGGSTAGNGGTWHSGLMYSVSVIVVAHPVKAAKATRTAIIFGLFIASLPLLFVIVARLGLGLTDAAGIFVTFLLGGAASLGAVRPLALFVALFGTLAQHEV